MRQLRDHCILVQSLQLLKLADQLNQIRELVVEREDQLQQMESQLNSTESERQNAVAGMEKKLKEMTQENNNLKVSTAQFFLFHGSLAWDGDVIVGTGN